MHRARLERVYTKLLRRHGPQNWWPARTALEMVVGAFLTQNTAWINVEKALANMKAKKLLSVPALRKASVVRIAKAIRPAGYFNQKSSRLKGFILHLDKFHQGRLSMLLAQKTEVLRMELLSIHGIGPETADSIVLYAAHKPSFVVDAYTRRIFNRLGIIRETERYAAIQSFFHKNLKRDVPTYNEYHALIVRHAKDTCFKRAPRCSECCLKNDCSKRGLNHEK